MAEDWSHSSPHLSSVKPGHQMLGAELQGVTRKKRTATDLLVLTRLFGT